MYTMIWMFCKEWEGPSTGAFCILAYTCSEFIPYTYYCGENEEAMKNRKQVVAVLLLSVSFTLMGRCSRLVLGDRTDATVGDSFSFNLGVKSVFDADSQIFYVGAADATTGNARPYSLSGITTSSLQAISHSPEKAYVNGTEQNNPFYAKGIAQLDLVSKRIVAVPNDATGSLYWITSALGASNQVMVGVTDIKDSNGATSTGVVSIADNLYGNVCAGVGDYLCAAVKPVGAGAFGTVGGGIAVFKKTSSGLVQQKAVPGDETTVRAVPIDVNTSVLKMNDTPLGSVFNNVIDLHWDAKLGRLFGAVAPGSPGTNGARALFTGYLSQQGANDVKLNLNAIAPAGAFTAASNAEIVAVTANMQTAFLRRVCTMHPSAGCSYVVVQVLNDLIYCLPLVDESVDPAKKSTWSTSATHATLAKKEVAPTDYYTTGPKGVSYLSGRGFQTQATAAGDLYSTADDEDLKKMRVGRGAVLGDISDLQVYKDTVFVSTNSSFAPATAGVWYSQALFDANGVIVSWTPWQKIAIEATGDPRVEGIGYASDQGLLFMLDGPTGAPDTVSISGWGTSDADGILGGTTTNASVGLVAQLNAEFPQSRGGVMGLFDFNSSNEAFATGVNSLSLMIATGYQKVVIVKTGAADGLQVLIPTVGDFTTDKRTFTAGAISNDSVEADGVTAATTFISVTGGDLTSLGAISCATIIEDTVADGGYIVVGGTGGVAILRHTTNRTGWATTGLLKDLSDATAFSTDKSFQKIGTYTNVKKLWTAESSAGLQVLYILTDNALYRIDKDDLNLANPTASTIATLAGLNLPDHASFADCIACDRLGLLATSHGLYRTGNGNNISTAANTTAVGWTAVALPYGFTGVSKLIPVAGTQNIFQFAADGIGQVYVASSSVSLKNAALFSFATLDVNAAGAVAAGSFTLVSNPFSKDINGTILQNPFAHIGVFRNNFATNGATLLATSAQHLTTAPECARLPLSLGLRAPFNKQGQKLIDTGLGGASIRGVVRNSTTGSWMVYGDKGVSCLE